MTPTPRTWLRNGFLLLLAAITSHGGTPAVHFEDAFVFTFIDRPFEEEIGGPPFDRSIYAKAIDRCREFGAKGVVIKLFLDQARPGSGDDVLAGVMKSIPVILQARIEPATGSPEDLPERFVFPAPGLATKVAGDRGWMPLAKLATVAAGVGFVDFADEDVPLLETYRGRTYKSLVLCALELQSGAKVRLGADGSLRLGSRALPTDRAYVRRVTRSSRPLPVIAFADLLAGKIDSRAIKGRVVVLGYIGRNAPLIPTTSGDLTAHVFFGQCLRAVFEATAPEAP